MNCPTCESQGIYVIDSRQLKTENTIRRRRACKDCGHRFTTQEIIDYEPSKGAAKSMLFQIVNGADLDAIRKMKEITEIING